PAPPVAMSAPPAATPAPPVAASAPPVTLRPSAPSPSGPRVLRVGIDGRSLQGGFREDTGRGIGVYARELIRALAARRDLALTLWFEPALPEVPTGMVPPGVNVRRYARTLLPLRDRLASQLSVRAAAA